MKVTYKLRETNGKRRETIVGHATEDNFEYRLENVKYKAKKRGFEIYKVIKELD